jgi:hypothetical protein
MLKTYGTLGRYGTVALLAAASLVAGCDKDLPTDEVAQIIKDGLNAKLAGDGLTIATVTCPEKIKMKKGVSFECQVTFEGGGKMVAEVDQTDDKGNVLWRAKEELVLGSKVEKGIATGLASKGVLVNVKCGQSVYPSVKGSTFPCTARASDGKVLVFEVTVTSAKGDVSWKAADPEQAPQGR